MTYSLTLRQDLGRKLTIKELDDNFLYVLENASGGSGATGPQGPQGPGGGGSGGTFSFDFGSTYSGYSLGLTRFGFFSDVFTGTFSVGDLIVGSESGNSGVIDYVLFADGIYIGLDSFSGSAFYTPDYYINQNQVGELMGQITDYPNPGQVVVYDVVVSNGSLNEVSANPALLSTIENNTASLISTFSVVSNNVLLVESMDKNQERYGWIKTSTPEVIGVTYSAGVIGDSILGGATPGIASVFFSSFTNDVGVNGVTKLEQPYDETGVVMASLGQNITSYKLVTKGGNYEQHFDDVSKNCAFMGLNFNYGVEISHRYSGCETSFCVDACGVFYCRGGAFYLPTSGFGCGCGSAYLKGTMCGCDVYMSFDQDTTNSCFGYLAGFSNTSGSSNAFIGVNAGFCNTSGNNNTFIGVSSGNYNNCDNNTFVGVNSGTNNICGGDNTFLGAGSGNKSSGDNNTFLGYNAGYYTTCHNNVAVGFCAGSSNPVCNTIAIGSCAEPIVSGDFAIGSSAYPILTGTTASVNGGSLDALGVAYMCVIINGTRYKLPLYQ